ncbi:MAG: glycosyl hydrolase [Bacteroidetes bacterium MedPE-SWsnd-G1]|nr:MAG: glycosyl hydrolase [Bacteroidetes bacterium MedPE-SWsnd-G1]
MKKINLVLLSVFSSIISFAQQPATSASEIQEALKLKNEMANTSLVKNIEFTNIGPTVMSGRVVDLAVNPDEPTEFYVAYASGGVWHTTNNGTTFTPIIDNADTQNIADIDVHWASRTIWVGTGENNASRSTYAGIGLLKSEDNGETWANVGLHDSHHIARILINPKDKNEVVVGVTGHLYSTNKERGMYKTTDGGKTWKQTLFVDEASGIIDVQVNPNDYNLMFASSWTKDRKAWNFSGNGNNSGIYKSTDAGESWVKVSTDKSGFPTGDGVGRIGLAIYDSNTIYAIHDSQFRRPEETSKDTSKEMLVKDDFKTMSKDDFMALDNSKLNAFLKQNGFQEKYRAENVKQLVSSGSVKPIDIANYLEDANSLLFDTPVIGAEVYKSTDGGITWNKTHEDYLEGLYFSYGYYFGHIYVSPHNAEHIYIYGVPIVKSKDGGKTYSSISASNVHSDHHALWINPENANHLINGNDGGVNITYDDGENWIKNNSPSVGQFYAINIDHEKNYNVYGGLQDNGVWVGPHNATESKRWHGSGDYPWKGIMGGDGMQVQIDNRNSDIVYTGFQFGNYFRIDRTKNKNTYIQPKHTLGENPYRFNWQTPILLSPHNQDILYLGGNKLMRSMNKGDDWEAISDDLTNGGKKGNVAYGTLTTIDESPFQFGLIYTGSDDGLVHVTKNGGGTWEHISTSLPKDLWVSRVIASKHKKERVYLTLNGYRWDDFNVYVYKSDDYGKTWKTISSNIPTAAVNVIREDTENENILYVGTDNGTYISFNQGESWELFSKGLNAAAVHDIVIQPEAKHLLIGTHGRSIYKTSIANIQQMNEKKLTSDLTLFDVSSIRASSRWGAKRGSWGIPYEPSKQIEFYSAKTNEVLIQILDTEDNIINEFKSNTDKGFNAANYDLTYSKKAVNAYNKKNKEKPLKPADNGKYYLKKGTYTVKIGDEKTKLEIK